VAIFSLRTLASPSSGNVNYDKKQLTGGKVLSCSFRLYRIRKYVSYGFPIINFCNPRVHYETPCILRQKYTQFYENCLKYIKPKALPCCGTTGLMVGVLEFAMVLGVTLVMLTKPATQYAL
jgi:hypothetical protein